MDPEKLIELYIEEDLSGGDITTKSLGVENVQARAFIVSNENCILAGGEESIMVFEKHQS